MTGPTALIRDLLARGARLTDHGGQLRVNTPKGVLDGATLALLKMHKLAILHLLATDAGLAGAAAAGGPAPRPSYPTPFTVALAGRQFPVTFWASQKLTGGVIALDTETEVIRDNQVPALALVSVSTDKEAYLVHPNQIAEFLAMHIDDMGMVFHHAAFDFWVLHEHLGRVGRADLQAGLWDMAGAGWLHDTMLLDMLIGLATDGTPPIPRDLGVVASDWAGINDLDKADPYRLRYAEIIGKDWSKVDPGFFIYAAKDAIATAQAYSALTDKAESLVAGTEDMLWPNAVQRFGQLSEAVQVRGAIALDRVGKLGIHVDRAALDELGKRLHSRMDELVSQIRALPDAVGLFKVDKAGKLIMTKTGTPSKSDKRLEEILVKEAGRVQGTDSPVVPRTEKGKVSKVAEGWQPYAAGSPFIKLWLELNETGKLLAFTAPPSGDRIHPHYSVMMRTGRTSCSGPNLQQIPRSGGFRECFTPAPGFVFLTIDYSYIELVTLAAVCLQRYGSAKLAEVISQGTDPHCYTAALITGMELDQFMALKQTDEAQFKSLRQKAKALNFGIPGGLGADSLRAYAQGNYGVEMSQEQAQAWREKLITQVYPELATYLADRTMETLAGRLGCGLDELWASLASPAQPGRLQTPESRLRRRSACSTPPRAACARCGSTLWTLARWNTSLTMCRLASSIAWTR